jgi:hypothetical protein
LYDDYDDGDDHQDVDKSSEQMEPQPADQPEHEQDNSNCPEHTRFFARGPSAGCGEIAEEFSRDADSVGKAPFSADISES